MMKKALSLVLALVLVLGLCGSALAATVSPSADKTTVEAGDTVTVTLTQDETLENISSYTYYLGFDETLFKLTGSEKGDVHPAMKLSQLLHSDKRGGANYMISATKLSDDFVTTFKAGVLYKLTFTALEDITEEKAASFTLYRGLIADTSYKTIEEGQVKDPVINITVTPASTNYTVTLSPAEQSKVVGEDATIDVTVGGKHTGYAAADFRFTYDATALTFRKDASTIPESAVVSDQNGTLRILIYGDTKAMDTPFKLVFRPTKTGDATVTLTSAKIDESANATQDAPEAEILNGTAVIKAANYTVTFLQDYFIGDTVAEPGKDYTFSAKDTHYDYTFDATMGGEAVTVADNGDGTYTIKNVSGNLVIGATQKGKQYPVTVTGSGKDDVTVAAYARYGENFNFSHDNLDTDTYDYTMTVTIDGKTVTANLLVDMGDSRLYLIAGAEITGPIVINVEKTVKPPKTTAITFVGSGSGDVKGGTTQTATNGQDFTFELNAETGYTYTVKLGDEELTASADGKYTIPAAKLTGEALTVTVEKALDMTVEVNAYVKLQDARVMYLVTVQGTLADGQVYTYDGHPMYYSEKYQAYCYLVISDQALPTVREDAAAKIATAAATAENVVYDYDVNGTKVVDINDAQLVYNMYNAVYDNFETVSMMTFLRADVNGSRDLNVEDVSAVVNAIV